MLLSPAQLIVSLKTNTNLVTTLFRSIIQVAYRINSLSASGQFLRPLITFANNLDPDEALQNTGPHLKSKLFETQIVYQQN